MFLLGVFNQTLSIYEVLLVGTAKDEACKYFVFTQKVPLVEKTTVLF